MDVDQNQKFEEPEFWGSLGILLKNYHAINKNVFETKKIMYFSVKNELKIQANELSCLAKCVADPSSCREVLNSLGMQVEDCSEDYLHDSIKQRTNETGILFLTKILPKTASQEDWYNLQVVDYREKSFLNLPLREGLASNYPYKVKYCDGSVVVVPLDVPDWDSHSIEKWCTYVFLPKLIKWAIFYNADSKSVQSLQLVDVEEYNNLYNELKKKHGKSIVEIWPENTDPLKHVYEDIAIATYLILLWKSLGKIPKNFVDVGCGNGLLVHILNSESYCGYGIDIRKRKIWDLYPETTKLKEEAVIPNEYASFANADWIIGNHSDELSPWIPVIAAHASYECSYFLLPCCAYEFNGKKFQRRDCKFSVYNDFLNYVSDISVECGFFTKIDRLKIPSTKRVALVGSKRVYPKEEHKAICAKIDDFISLETLNSDIKLREKVEEVRNCTKIDRKIINEIVLKIFNFLITSDEIMETDGWRRGKIVRIPDLVSVLSKEDLFAIKQENGGLKTLLKNNHSIFEVRGGNVGIRIPSKISENRKKGAKIKQKECFFHFNHPDGCLLTDEDCSFKHAVDVKSNVFAASSKAFCKMLLNHSSKEGSEEDSLPTNC